MVNGDLGIAIFFLNPRFDAEIYIVHGKNSENNLMFHGEIIPMI